MARGNDTHTACSKCQKRALGVPAEAPAGPVIWVVNTPAAALASSGTYLQAGPMTAAELRAGAKKGTRTISRANASPY